MTADQAVKRKINCKKLGLCLFWAILDEVLNILYLAWKLFQSKCLMFYIWHGN